MDDKRTDALFDAIGNRVDLDKWLESKRDIYEEKIVKLVLNHFNAMSSLNELKSDALAWSGSCDKLTFNWLHDKYPNFPIRLCALKVPAAVALNPALLFARFTTNKIYQEFVKAREYLPNIDQYSAWALVFSYTGLGHLVIHNSDLITSTARFTKVVNKKNIYIDLLTEFLSSLASSSLS